MKQLTMFLGSPLPAPVPCPERHFDKCLRLVLAVLPKRSSDEISGELFVAAYRRILGSYPEAAINYLAEKALETCKWVPTIAECKEILDGWVRNDEHTQARVRVVQALAKERRLREEEERQAAGNLPELTQEEIDAMSPQLIRLGINCGALVETEDGKIIPAPEEKNQ